MSNTNLISVDEENTDKNYQAMIVPILEKLVFKILKKQPENIVSKIIFYIKIALIHDKPAPRNGQIHLERLDIRGKKRTGFFEERNRENPKRAHRRPGKFFQRIFGRRRGRNEPSRNTNHAGKPKKTSRRKAGRRLGRSIRRVQQKGRFCSQSDRKNGRAEAKNKSENR